MTHLTEDERRVLRLLCKALCDQTACSRSIKFAQRADRKAGDSLVMAGLAVRTRDGRLEATMAGLEANES